MAALIARLASMGGLVLCLACAVVAQVSFEEKKDMIYDVVPKLRLKGQGFSSIANLDDLKLSFLPKRQAGKDYTVTVQSDTVLVLELSAGKRWVQLEPGSGPQTLFLSAASLAGTEILDSGIQVASVLPTPVVEASSKTIYMSATPRLMINGTNFNPKQTELYFDPPLAEGIDFSKQIQSSSVITLIKKYGYDGNPTWGSAPGPLKVVAINTGGGRLSLQPELGGVTIAEIQADLDGHGVTVRTHEEYDIYQSTPTLVIGGEGFNTASTQLRFGNGLRGQGANYTTMSVEPNQITLSLSAGSKWRQNVDSLPGPLVLLAANAGAGWVPLGPTAVKAGRRVATVFEDPSVVENKDNDIFRTHTHEIIIEGTGFNTLFKPVFVFQPPLAQDAYFTQVVDRTHAKLTLQSSWMAEGQAGPLSVVSLNTGAGMKTFDAPVQVAKVQEDTAAHESGVTVFPEYSQALYQSSAGPLYIHGSGFTGEPKLNLDPPLWQPKGYTLTVKSPELLELHLTEGSKWAQTGGPLVVKAINVGDGQVTLGGGKGIKVATILNDPVIFPGELSVYATHTKHFTVRGTGFVSTLDPNRMPVVVLDNTPPSAYAIQDDWNDNTLTLRLQQGAWATVSPGSTTTIKMLSIDTGAGPIIMPDGGVTIAVVHEDSPTALCEDSCIYANDKQCDEPVKEQGGQGGYGWSLDDDANWYVDDDYAGGYKYVGYLTTYMYGLDDDMDYFGAAACEPGTDCTDCGVQVIPDGLCDNTCRWARDGECDDPRVGGICQEGTDCQDCGPWGDAGSNFTNFASAYYTSEWYTDDDAQFLFDDDAVLLGQEINSKPIYQRTAEDHHVVHKETPGAGTIFMDVLWAMVILVGGSVSLGVCMVAYRHFKGQGGASYLPVDPSEELEMAARRDTSGTTPDVVRIG